MNKQALSICIENLTDAQAIAISDFLAMWASLSNLGGSRWTAFYADGDGNFHPKITVNGSAPVAFGDGKRRWGKLDSPEVYRLDFDEIAWKLAERGKV